MKVVDIDNTSIYIHKYNNICYKTEIPLIDNVFIVISFNSVSSLYNDTNYEGKSPFKPYCNNLWYIGRYDKYGSGIGELK